MFNAKLQRILVAVLFLWAVSLMVSVYRVATTESPTAAILTETKSENDVRWADNKSEVENEKSVPLPPTPPVPPPPPPVVQPPPPPPVEEKQRKRPDPVEEKPEEAQVVGPPPPPSSKTGKFVYNHKPEFLKHGAYFEPHFPPTHRQVSDKPTGIQTKRGPKEPKVADCPQTPERDFDQTPVVVIAGLYGIRGGPPSVHEECSVPCLYTSSTQYASRADAFMSSFPGGGFYGHDMKVCPFQKSALHSMESEIYYSQLAINNYRNEGYDIGMTTRWTTEVPTPYGSWAEYNLAAQPQEKDILSCAFISNCGAHNNRLQYLEEVMKYTKDGAGKGGSYSQSKLGTIRRCKFTFTFENSNVEDYISEKLTHAIEAGSVPITMGAPNMLDYVPRNDSYIDPRDFESPKALAEYLNYLDTHDDEYQRECIMIRWELGDPLNKSVMTGSVRPSTGVLQVKIRERGTFKFRWISLDELTMKELVYKTKEAFAAELKIPRKQAAWPRELFEIRELPDVAYGLLATDETTSELEVTIA